MAEKTFAKGIYFDKPREGAPDFVKGRVSIKAVDAIEFISAHVNEKGYVNLDLLKAKEGGKLYFALNDYKPKTEAPATAPEYPEEDISPEDVPF